MENTQTQFNKYFKSIFIFGIIFLIVLFVFDKFNLFNQINNSQILVLIFLIPLVISFSYFFSKGLGLHKSMGHPIDKDTFRIDIAININPKTHPLLRKYLYFLIFPFIKKISYLLTPSGLVLETNSFSVKRKSHIKWDNVAQYLSNTEYKKEYSAIILYRKVLSPKPNQFNPITYLYFNPNPENILILVNSDEEANKVIDYIKNLPTIKQKKVL